MPRYDEPPRRPWAEPQAMRGRYGRDFRRRAHAAGSYGYGFRRGYDRMGGFGPAGERARAETAGRAGYGVRRGRTPGEAGAGRYAEDYPGRQPARYGEMRVGRRYGRGYGRG